MIRISWVILFFMIGMLAAGPAALAESASSAPTARVMIVLDASGSMWGQIDGKPKIAIARDVIRGILNGWDPKMDLGLTVYGHRRKGSCSDIQTLIPVGRPDAKAIMRAVDGLNPKGKTPLSEAVRRAAEALKYTEERATVILVSDGRETCGADPCAVGRALEKSGVDFTAHVIGFDVKRGEQAGLRCLAKATGGRFFPAKDAAGLRKALTRTVKAVKKAATKPLTLRVPGTACLFLAGVKKDGFRGYGDSLPKVAPVAVKIPAHAKRLTLDISGRVGHCQGCYGAGMVTPKPDYLKFAVASLRAPLDGLIGVFLGPGNGTEGRNGTVLGRPFFIHHFSRGNSRKTIAIPSTARVLYLGTMDAYGWYNNVGNYIVKMKFIK